MKHLLSALFLFLLIIPMQAQTAEEDNTPYRQIPDAPEGYTAGAMVSRMIDGLGFRYYWASEGLTLANLNYKPSAKARNLEETIDHIYGLSRAILFAAKKEVDDRSLQAKETLSFEAKRKQTLLNFQEASILYKETNDIAAHKIVFRTKQGDSEFPFWNNLNGFIADAIWHSGQVVVMRRAAGNPINSKISVFTGTVRE